MFQNRKEALALALPPDTERAQDLGLPLVGLVRAWTDVWSGGRELVGMACTLGALAVGALALWRRGLRHPLGWALAIQVAFLLVLGVNPASITFGAARMAMAPMLLAVLVLATPLAVAQPVRTDEDAPQHGGTGRSGPGAGSGGSSNR